MRKLTLENHLHFSKKVYFFDVIDFNFTNKNDPTSGSVLIAEPFLNDTYFTRSVIFLCEHTPEGSFGFVLNNFLENGLKDLIPNFPDIDIRVSLGGPVDSTNLYFIHSLGDKIPNAQEIAKDIYIGGKFEAMKALIVEDPETAKQIRFFIGYSGWDQGQLDDELKEKSWVVLDNIPQEIVLNTQNDHLWKELMETLGGKFEVMAKFPKNPSDN